MATFHGSCLSYSHRHISSCARPQPRIVVLVYRAGPAVAAHLGHLLGGVGGHAQGLDGRGAHLPVGGMREVEDGREGGHQLLNLVHPHDVLGLEAGLLPWVVQVEPLAPGGPAAVHAVGHRLPGLHHQPGEARGVPHADVRLHHPGGVECVVATSEVEIGNHSAVVTALHIRVVVLRPDPLCLGLNWFSSGPPETEREPAEKRFSVSPL